MTNPPLVLEIKGNSLDDGPGIRSVVFMKGCPLSCVWCHNPESKKADVQISFDPEVCIGCDSCIDTCGKESLSRTNSFFINRDTCELCFDCTEACPSGALKQVGREMDTRQIVSDILRDKPFFDTSNGGITISGGEPTLHMGFCSELLQKLKSEGVHTLIETCGQFDYDRFEKNILPFTDTIYFDIKFIDPDLHKKHCGITNTTILDNFSRLHRASLEGGFTLLPRTPLIPEITDTPENMEAIAAFLKEQGITEAKLLSYNPLWHEKTGKIGESNPISKHKAMQHWLSSDAISRCEAIFKNAGITAPN